MSPEFCTAVDVVYTIPATIATDKCKLEICKPHESLFQDGVFRVEKAHQMRLSHDIGVDCSGVWRVATLPG